MSSSDSLFLPLALFFFPKNKQISFIFISSSKLIGQYEDVDVASLVAAACVAVKLSAATDLLFFLCVCECVCGILGSVPRKPGIEGWLA